MKVGPKETATRTVRVSKAAQARATKEKVANDLAARRADRVELDVVPGTSFTVGAQAQLAPSYPGLNRRTRRMNLHITAIYRKGDNVIVEGTHDGKMRAVRPDDLLAVSHKQGRSPATTSSNEDRKGGIMPATKTAPKPKATAKAAPKAKPVVKAKPAAKATPKAKDQRTVRTADAAMVSVPAELKKLGVVRITGRTEAKQKVNLAIVTDVVKNGIEPDDEKLAKKYGIGSKQIRRIVGLAKGELSHAKAS